MPTNIEKACQFLITNAQPKSLHKCAEYVRRAVDFGFNSDGSARKVLTIVGNAKDCGKAYETFGFTKVFSFPEQSKADYKKVLGDIAIIQYEPSGHICMNTSQGWISDFKQRDMYGSSQRDKNPSFAIYRFNA